ncbi:HNH endonuclease signature motif containing protein [Phenylobacterium sp.]|uniref:HNH endonuclease signature motif containing protein n=1 Tax=Phenylobacterium sp. TaxID=1871053 RepID=UPI003563B065
MNTLPPPSGDEQKKIAAWTVCQVVQGLPPRDWRIDAFGHLIRRTDYGVLSEYGWEIDHAHPSALGGADAPPNLRALHWRKNRELGGHLGNAINALGDRPMTAPRNMFGSSFGFGSRRS